MCHTTRPCALHAETATGFDLFLLQCPTLTRYVIAHRLCEVNVATLIILSSSILQQHQR